MIARQPYGFFVAIYLAHMNVFGCVGMSGFKSGGLTLDC